MRYVVDHTEPQWALRYQTNGFVNGAATYSADLVKHQVDLWQGDNIIISTCPLLHTVDGLPDETDLVVQYLHEYSYALPLANAQRVISEIKTKYKRIVFVTAYYGLYVLLKRAGIDTVFIPMTIEANRFTGIKADGTHQEKSIIYFGNVTPEKQKVHRQLKHAFEKQGWKFDTLSHGKFNGFPIETADVHGIIQGYKYGIGVGRCALEMLAQGLHIIVAGAEFGGIMVSDADFEAQTLTNMNGRVTTFDRNIETCIECLDDTQVRTNDIYERLPEIEQTIKTYLQTGLQTPNDSQAHPNG